MTRLLFPNGITITVVTPAMVSDGYGGQQPDWDNTTTVTVEGCGIAPLQSEELPPLGRQSALKQATLYAPTSVALSFTSRIETTSLGDWEVVGEPSVWVSPYTGNPVGQTARISRIEAV